MARAARRKKRGLALPMPHKWHWTFARGSFMLRGMYAQHLIKRSLGTVEAQARVGALRRARPDLHRTGLAAAVCEEFGFREAGGVAQTSGCLSALRALERVGRFVCRRRGRRAGVACAAGRRRRPECR